MDDRAKEVLNLIKSNPGITTREIIKTTGLKHQQLINAIMRIENDETNGALFAEGNKNDLYVFKIMGE